MKKGVFRLCAGLLAAVLLSLAVVPCYAESDKYTSTGTFWQAVADKWYFNGTVIPAIIGTVSDKVCSESGDKKHHGSLKSYEQNPDKSYTAICDFCSAEFLVYDADLSAAYDDYVATLPVQGCNSDGNLIWQPLISDLSSYGVSCVNSSAVWFSFSTEYSANSSGNGFSGLSSRTISVSKANMSVTVSSFPVAGSYRTLASHAFTIRYLGSNGIGSVDCTYSESKWFRGSPDSSMRIDSNTVSQYFSSTSASVNALTPVFEVVPDTALSGDTYNINTRPTSITGGNYGIVGDNGQITKVEDNSTIINETNNTYYNPVTGQTVPITGWTYDYSDRSYKVTMEGGKTSTVTYGDENISITETTVNESGDTITNNYTIYYLVDGSGSENPPCEHDWQEASSTDPTCTLPGKVTLSCTKCQQTKTETLPALGHNWQVKKTVTTQYDEEGNLTQQGYTIFECSRCHEQYKSSDGTIPPGGGSGTDPGGEDKETIWDKLGNLIGAVGSGIIDLIDAALGKVLDALIVLAEKMMEKLKTVVEAVLSIFDELPALFDGFLDFLVALFPFLPAELMAILTFGIIAIVFIGIIKAVRR